MNSTARGIFAAMIRAAREVDPEAAAEFESALAKLGGRQPKSEDQALVWSQAQTARALGCSRWTVRNMTRDGQLHPVHLRGALRFRRSEVLALVGETR